MTESLYPDLDTLCRLCLKKNDDSFPIFSTDETQLSIPMRIMTLSLDVKEKDGLPKQICSDCRYQLEKFYLFRKRSQLADNKLRKHIKLLSLGKRSRVFCKADNDEDEFDEDELEFEDSVRFLKEQDELKEKQKDQRKQEYKQELEIEFQKKLEESKTELRKECWESLRVEVTDEVRQELRTEVYEEVKEELRSEVVNNERESLRKELMEQCRKEQIGELINELAEFLLTKRPAVKRNSIQESISNRQQSPRLCKRPRLSSASRDDITEEHKTDSIALAEDVEDDDIEAYQSLSSGGTLEDLKAEFENVDVAEGDYSIVADNKIYIINENIEEITKEPEMIQENAPIAISQILDVAYTYDKDNRKNVTSYQIEDNGEIQFCQKKRKKRRTKKKVSKDSTSSSVLMLNLDNDIVEFINVDEKGNLIKNSTDPQGKHEIKRKSDRSNDQSTAVDNRVNVNDNVILRRHTETVKTFHCELCPIVFSTEKSLNRHMRSHSRVLEKGIHYQCPTCKLYLSCSSALKRHMVVHTGARPYACGECGKSFAQREILKRHMDTHRGIKPYECPHCKQCFSQKTNLKTHISKLHLDSPKQHSCHLCEKKYTHASGLSRHLNTHSGLMYECNECKRRFHDRSSVKRHIINMHKVDVLSDEIHFTVK